MNLNSNSIKIGIIVGLVLPFVGFWLWKGIFELLTIVNVMEHPEFRKFFNDNFSSWDDVKTILLFLKLYEKIEKSTTVKLNGYQKLSILDGIMKDGELRHEICQEVSTQAKKISTPNLLK